MASAPRYETPVRSRQRQIETPCRGAPTALPVSPRGHTGGAASDRLGPMPLYGSLLQVPRVQTSWKYVLFFYYDSMTTLKSVYLFTVVYIIQLIIKRSPVWS